MSCDFLKLCKSETIGTQDIDVANLHHCSQHLHREQTDAIYFLFK